MTDTVADISYYAPYVDSSNQGSTAAWTMLTDPACGPYGLAQVGQAETPWSPGWPNYSVPFTEVEFCSGSPFNGPKIINSPPGPLQATHRFEVQDNGQLPGVVAAYMDSTNVLANTTVDFLPNRTINGSETHQYLDQDYGGSSASAQGQFTQMSQCDTTSGCYTTGYCLTSGNLANPCLGPTWRWDDIAITGSTTFNTYDADCPN